MISYHIPPNSAIGKMACNPHVVSRFCFVDFIINWGRINMSLRQQKIDAILKKYGNMITGLNDLTAGDPPSALFYVLADKLSYLLDADPKIAISSRVRLKT